MFIYLKILGFLILPPFLILNTQRRRKHTAVKAIFAVWVFIISIIWMNAIGFFL
jgi:uncharacterized membrane protein